MALIKMSEHHKHTEFLKHCLRYDDSPERHEMMEKLGRLQRDVRIIYRACWVMGILLLLSLAAFGYATILMHDFSYQVQQSVMNIIVAFLVGLSISLLVFIVLGIIFHRKLHRQREACRQLLMRLFATRLAPEF